MNLIFKNILFTSFLILIFCFLNIASYGQNKKFSLVVEYTPNFSKMTNEIVDENYKLSHLGLIKVEYATGVKINPTIGFGLMNTGEKLISDLDGQFDIEQITFRYNYNYLMIPIGVKFKIKELLFIQPEFGIGYKLSNKVKRTTEFIDGRKETEKSEFGILFGEFNKVALPIFLTVGTEVNLGMLDLLIGLKGYYNTKQVINNVPRKGHSYGIGISLGLKV